MTCGVSMRVRPLPRPVIGRLGQCQPVIGWELAARGVAPESPPLAPSQLRKTSFSLLSIILLHYSTLSIAKHYKNMTSFLEAIFQHWSSRRMMVKRIFVFFYIVNHQLYLGGQFKWAVSLPMWLAVRPAKKEGERATFKNISQHIFWKTLNDVFPERESLTGGTKYKDPVLYWNMFKRASSS